MSSSHPTPEAIAAFRYQVIAPLVSRPLSYGEQRAVIRTLCQQMWQTPDGNAVTLSPRTIYRWLAAYRAEGWGALAPSPRADAGALRRLDPEIVALAIQLREENPTRSVQQILRLLELAGRIEPGAVKYSTLTYHFRRRGVLAKQAPNPDTVLRRRQAPYANAEWQGDTQYTVRLPDPARPGRTKQAYLFAFIDDYSRFIVGAQFFFEENRPRLEEVLKWAIIRHGLPEILHVDNGSVYASDYLQRVCGELAIDLRHGRPYHPQSKGKIERWFRRVDQQFTGEVQPLIAEGRVQTLADLNAVLDAWLAVGYQDASHKSLAGATPRSVWTASRAAHPPRTQPVETVRRIFLWQDTRKADKTGVIQLAGNRYEVDARLARKKFIVRYDPYDLTVIHCEYQGQVYPDATPLVLRHHRHREVPNPEPVPAKPATGLNYLALAQAQHEAQRHQQQARIHYALHSLATPRTEEGPSDA